MLPNVPAELLALPRWVARGTDKRPYSGLPLRPASTTDAGTWLTHAAAVAIATAENLAGVGFVFNGDGITGVDLDHCRNADGTLEPWAQKWVDRLASYTEVSPSGSGLHIFVRATLPGPGRKRKGAEGGAIEVYDTARYFTVTGAHVAGTPPTLEPRQDVIDDLYAKLGAAEKPATANAPTSDDHAVLARAFDARNGAKVLSLYQGSTSEHGSGSEADAALAAELAFWTRDAEQITRLMQGSGLRRDKWDEKRPGGTWLSENVIAKALTLTEKTHRAIDSYVVERQAFDTIEPEQVEWLWPSVIPYGMLTLVVGEPGYGKSLLTLDVAARLTRGAEMPDGMRTSPADALLVFSEDSPGIVVRPRLEAVGAVLSRVAHLKVGDGQQQLVLPDDLDKIRKHIEDTGARLIVIDPINTHISAKANSWKETEVRPILAAVAWMAEETGCAVVGIMHLNKTQTANALQRITGSGAFPAVARSVFLVGPHPEDKDLEERDQRKILACVKLNIGMKPRSRVFRIRGPEMRPVIEWEGETRHSATDMLGAQMSGVAADGKLEETVTALRDLLKKGPRAATEMFDLLNARGFSKATVTRAKKAAGIVSTQDTSDGGQRWTWRLPDELPFGGESDNDESDTTPF